MLPGMSPPRIALVVPCYDEAARLPVESFEKLRHAVPDLRLWFVDDGSTDGTRALLERLVARAPDAFRLIVRERNGGKAAAVRSGMQRALAEAPDYAGYWDADLATPLEELPGFVTWLETHPECEVALGSRVKLLGRTVDRSALRHYVGRVFATAVSLTLGIPVYDSQCGAKLFRSGPRTRALFEEPFLADWGFDVEILARALRARRARGLRDDDGWVREIPLERWIDVPGSKVRPVDFLRGLAELVRIRLRYRS